MRGNDAGCEVSHVSAQLPWGTKAELILKWRQCVISRDMLLEPPPRLQPGMCGTVTWYLDPWWPPLLLQRFPHYQWQEHLVCVPVLLSTKKWANMQNSSISYTVHIKVGSGSIYWAEYRAKTSGVTLWYKRIILLCLPNRPRGSAGALWGLGEISLLAFRCCIASVLVTISALIIAVENFGPNEFCL